MTTIGERLGEVLARIEAAARAAGRDPSAVSLLAVSKTWPAAAVREAAAAGQRAFGENYVQEGVDKVEALRDLSLEWHFIGPLQSNKTRPVANAFDWVHGIDRLPLFRWTWQVEETGFGLARVRQAQGVANAQRKAQLIQMAFQRFAVGRLGQK